MLRYILPLGLLPVLAWGGSVSARTATAHVERLEMSGVVLEGVTVRLDWPEAAREGQLRIEASSFDAPMFGYGFHALRWSCPVAHVPDIGWRCDGVLRAGNARPMRLALELGAAAGQAVLAQGDARATVSFPASGGGPIEVDLARIPVVWLQTLVQQAWAPARLQDGRVDGRVVVTTGPDAPLQLGADLQVRGVGLETVDGTVATAGVATDLRVDYSGGQDGDTVSVDGRLGDGELLFGNLYLQVPDTGIAWRIEARREPGQPWALPLLQWRDPGTLELDARLALAPDMSIDRLDLALRSPSLVEVPGRYLAGWLGLSGMPGLTLEGGAAVNLRMASGAIQALVVDVDHVNLRDGNDRYAFEQLDGRLDISTRATLSSQIGWQGGRVHGVAFGPAQFTFDSFDGRLLQREAVDIGVLGGQLRLDGLTMDLPNQTRSLQFEAGLSVREADIGELAQTLGLPAFRGTIEGQIPNVRYADGRLDFDGGLSIDVFDGRVVVSALSMERLFGTAPSLAADLELRDLDLLAITEVFDFGSISGRMSGYIRDLRLVDWQLSAFDAAMYTVPRRGVRQRISQRAVQDISSVGDPAFVQSVQGQLIGLFDDFGYRRIGIRCRLVGTVCHMAGLDSRGDSFTIVQGSGLPRLNVIGFNPQVDWPTLVERLRAAATGDVAPTIE